MTSNTIKQLQDGEHHAGVLAVLSELRPAFTSQELHEQIVRLQQRGYQVAYVECIETSEILCVAGFVIQEKLAWGKHIYVDDLVTTEAARGRGAGKAMLDWLAAKGTELGCAEIHLDSGVQRFAAHRFYLREGFEIRSHHFMRSLK